MSVRWVDAFGYEDRYLASSNGEIRHKTPRAGAGVLKAFVGDCTRGYARVCICRRRPDGGFLRSRSELVHRIIWQSFNGPLPDTLMINHKNGIKHDNRLVNLESCTAAENVQHRFDVLGHISTKRGSLNNGAVLTEADIPVIRSVAANGGSKLKLAAHYKVSVTAIWKVVRRETWHHVA